MGSVKGPLVADDDGWRWELTMRGLKRWWRLQFLGGVAALPMTEVDRRQGGWGGGSVLL
jgi:hypothetical protein